MLLLGRRGGVVITIRVVFGVFHSGGLAKGTNSHAMPQADLDWLLLQAYMLQGVCERTKNVAAVVATT